MMKIKEFYKILPASLKNNLLSVINNTLLSGAWDDVITTDEMTQYTMNIYLKMADKDLSNIIESYIEMLGIDIENITSNEFNNLIVFVLYSYKDKWLKLLENVYEQTYNPIWNVDGTESVTHTFEHGKTVTETKNLTHTMNKGSTDTTTVNSDITENSRNGFNSASAVPVGKSSHTGSSTVTGSGFDSDVDTGTDTYANTGTDTERETRTRGGNIGVTSTQNMLEQEIELRNKFNYFTMIAYDIINEFSLRIYNN